MLPSELGVYSFQIIWISYKYLKILLLMSTTNWHLPSTSTGVKSRDAAAADLQHPMKGAQGGDQKWGTMCFGKNWQNRSSDRHVQETILGPQFLCIIPKSALKSCMVKTAPVTSRNFLQNLFGCLYPTFTKITYILSFPSTSLEQFFRVIWNPIAWAIVLILVQIKLATFMYIFLSWH